jgi:predicted transcriptional regulator
MSNQKLTERLISVRLDKPLKLELQRISEELGLPQSMVVRASLRLVIHPPNEVQKIIDRWKKDSDRWYEKREKKDNGKDRE